MRLTDTFSVRRDPHGWTLIETYTGRGRDNSSKTMHRETYHATLKQAIVKCMESEVSDCQDLREVIDKIDAVASVIAENYAKSYD